MDELIDDQVSRLRAMVEFAHVWGFDCRDVAAIQMAVRVLSVLQLADRDEIRLSIGNDDLRGVEVSGTEYRGYSSSWLECIAAAGKAMELANGTI